MSLKLLSILALAGSGLAQTPSLQQVLNSTSDLSTLQSAVGLIPDVLSTLSNARNITILAPSNAAFNKIGNQTLQGLTSNPGLFTAILQYHVLNGTHNSSQITNTSAFVPSLLTNALFTNVTGGQVVRATRRNNAVVIYSGLLNNSTVTKADIAFTGGVIHIIDTVLTLPQTVSDTASAAELSSLRGALAATNLVDAVNTTPNVTVFAPLNQAFQNIGSALSNLSTTQISDVLKYHVVASGPIGYSSVLKNGTKLNALSGQELTVNTGRGGVFVNNARVVIADILIANGVLHVIDQVLNPSNSTAANTTNSQGVVAFAGASAVSAAPYTSGQPTPTTTIPAGVASAAADPTNSSGSSGSTSSRGAAPGPIQTGAVGMGALFGAAAVFLM